jgi:hypothetical protein
MTSDSLIDDARIVWQSQRREHPVMSIEEIRMKAQAVHRKVRRDLVVGLAIGFLLFAFCITIAVQSGNTAFRLICGAMAAVSIVIIYTAYKRYWPLHALSPNAAIQGCVEFYRSELQAQYRSVALWWRFLAPLVIFAFIRWNSLVRTSAIVPRAALPFVLVLILVLRRRVARTFRQKISALSSFEQQNS